MQVKTTNTHKETSFNIIKNSELFSKRLSMHHQKFLWWIINQK